ncbi:outer membrane protein [Gluconobacter thailandicus F149-1 = NBRC 100600]|uniref:Outer membrane protein n=1 Tax=Gluconobacter thailandicus NBRC 3257 TaxID=1381097 RepID=A0ABQ0ITK7_GLUTH|nr:Hint domain-containing protein [Gluconobacter thailandicus]GAD25554.1 outer membrane protein [Gluconobacter thailandicus NBRC 3257]GAN90890.1 outer membrane protein [Gluconobacter frateurii M-2]GAN92215.1 outer membrane protein [Gluconobacter thailandicus F149-1 = NBRC 100600]GEL85878.1 hypothetical protein GTH01_02360 [Gluconobacter thailandicus F149-1 = NBRC 100600]
MSSRNKTDNSSTTAAAQATASAPTTSGGSGTKTDPYILSSNSGTITLKAGKYYVVPDNVTIGKAVTNSATNDASGGINVNGAYLEIASNAHVNGTINMSVSGSSLKLDATPKWVYSEYNPGKGGTGQSTWTWQSIQSAVIDGLVTSDDKPNKAVSIVAEGVTSDGSVRIVGTYGTSTANGSELIYDKTFKPAGSKSSGYLGFEVLVPAKSSVLSGTAKTLPSNKTSDGEYIVGDIGSNVYVCFLAGAMIRMADGSEKAVEDIQVGEQVAALVDGQSVAREIVWTGRKFAYTRAGLPADEAGYPVRIAAGAIAEGVPSRDLFVTSEHSLFLNGGFVPVRMLVNGGSIAYDRSQSSFFYYHIETADHSVIFADDCATESFLDTGHKGIFEGSDNIISLRAKTWADAAAPLMTARDIVEPLHVSLAARSIEQGVSVDGAAEVTTDAGLHLVTTEGLTVHPLRQVGSDVSFMLPSGTRGVYVVSRTSRPCDTIGPFVDDRRQLGVLVGAAHLTSSNANQHRIVSHLDGQLSGWNASEGTHRWTTGYAFLVLPACATNVSSILTLEIAGAGPYLVADVVEGAQALSA